MADVNGTETNLHAYSGLVWKTGKWTINPAVRVDHFIFNMHDLLDPDNCLPDNPKKQQESARN
jgi:hypothetical protein